MNRYRAQLMVWLVVLAMFAQTGCRFGTPLTTASLGVDRASAQMRLNFVVPKEVMARAASRQVQYVSVERTRELRVTVEGNPNAADKDPTDLTDVQTAVATFAFAPTVDGNGDAIASAVLSGLPTGNNITVQVDVYDGMDNGATTPYRLETLGGIVDLLPGQTTDAIVNWRTTPTMEAVRTLRKLGDPQRLIAKSLLGVYVTGEPVVGASPAYNVDDPAPPASQPVVPAGTPKPGANIQVLMDKLIDSTYVDTYKAHPSLISGQPLAHLIQSFTAQHPDFQHVNAGYALPMPDHPGLTGSKADGWIKDYASAMDVKIYDVRGNLFSSGIDMWIEEPHSPRDNTSPFDFPHIQPGTWDVTIRQSASGVLPAREAAFPRTFTQEARLEIPQRSELPAGCMPGRTFEASGIVGLSDPHQMAFDSDNWLYIADTGNHRVVRFRNGVLEVVAGQTGIASPVGATEPADIGDAVLDTNTGLWNGGEPASATFRSPEGVGVEEYVASGTAYRRIYIADTGNHRVRVIDNDGKLRTVAGTGTPADNLRGSGPTSDLNGPTAIAIDDSGSLRNLYFHDSQNRKIRVLKLNHDNVHLGEFLTEPVAGILTPQNMGLAFQVIGPNEYLFYCDSTQTVAVQRWNTATKAGDTEVGGGNLRLPLTKYVKRFEIELFNITALAVDQRGNVYTADNWNNTAEGRVLYSNRGLFLDVFSILGVPSISTYQHRSGSAGDGKMSLQVGIARPTGIAIRRDHPLYDTAIFVGTAQNKVIEVKPW